MEWDLRDRTWEFGIKLSSGGHRCGVCHNTSDDQVSTQKAFEGGRKLRILELRIL